MDTEDEIMCIIYGSIEHGEDIPVRVHDACYTSEVLGGCLFLCVFVIILLFVCCLTLWLYTSGSLKCDCREQLDYAMDYIRTGDKGGMVIYLQQEGRGIGLANKIKAYSLQEVGSAAYLLLPSRPYIPCV